MSDLQGARQLLASLIDEHDKRKELAADAERLREGAVQRLSRLRGQQALDNVDLTERIQQAQQEIDGADAVLSAWPDAQALLADRIADAGQAVKAAEVAVLTAELGAIREAEPVDRKSFAEALNLLALVGFDLNRRLQRKLALRSELAQLGVAVPDIGDCELPQWNRWGIGQQSAIDEAQAMIARYQ